MLEELLKLIEEFKKKNDLDRDEMMQLLYRLVCKYRIRK
jgi:hypothetical protein